MHNFLQNWIHIDTKMMRNIVQKKVISCKIMQLLRKRIDCFVESLLSDSMLSTRKILYLSKRNEAKVHVQLIYILGFLVHVNNMVYKIWGLLLYLLQMGGGGEMLNNRVIYLCFHQTSSFFHNSTSL